MLSFHEGHIHFLRSDMIKIQRLVATKLKVRKRVSFFLRGKEKEKKKKTSRRARPRARRMGITFAANGTKKPKKIPQISGRVAKPTVIGVWRNVS